jgi:sarcosine oxidase, subunit gamma
MLEVAPKHKAIQVPPAPNAATRLQVRVGEARGKLTIRSVHPEASIWPGLPREVGTSAVAACRVLCLGPGEWLAISATLSLPCLHSAAISAESGLIAVDVTSAMELLELRGSAARELLSGGCGIDFDLRRFAIGRCCRTRLAMIAVVIDHVGENAYNLYCTRSYLAYMRSWLADKSRYLKP